MKINQFESDERRRDDSPGDRPWRKHAAPLNRPPSDPNYPKTPFNRDEWMKSSKPMEEGSDIPVPGDTIRTPKLEGKVSKVEEGYVYFTTADGRNMRNTIQNCTVVEKLADQESGMFEDEEIDEVSTELLAKYKTAAGKDATAADKKGDYARGNKRFSGIVKATKKQFDNDAKKRNINEEEVPGEYVKDFNGWQGDAKSYGFTVKRNGDNFIATNEQGQKVGVWDGSEVGFGVLFNTPQELQSKLQEIQKAGGTSKYSREKYSQEVRDYPAKLAKTMAEIPKDAILKPLGIGEGGMGGINRSAPSNDVSYEKVLDEVYGKWNEEQVNELSVDKLRAYKDAAKSPASFKNRPLRKLAKTIQGVKGATDRIDTKTGNRRQGPGPERGNNESVDSVYEDLKATFGDLLGRQHQEKEKVVTKIDITKLPSKNENFAIWFRPQTDKLKPVKWQVRSKDGSVTRHEGSSSNEKDAFNDAEDWIAKSGETSSASNNVTVNFNAVFAREVAPEGQTLWTTFWEGPIFVYSESPQEGYTRTVIRTPEHSRTAGAALLPVTGMSPKKANEIGLRTNSRYTLGPREELEPGVYGYTLQWHSRVEKGIPVPLKEPSITTSSKEENVSEVYQGPHLGDPVKLTKAPKSAMQGKGDIRFSELVQDTIKAHGLKWAFNEYVIKHGLPPRQFQIFAGLATKPKAVEPAKPDWADPSKATKPTKPQSWWQKLRGKLPFEE